MRFLLPYIVYGLAAKRDFVQVEANTISAAAAIAEIQIRNKLTASLNRNVCVAVAEVDFTWRDRATGQEIPRPPEQPKPRRRRRMFRRW